MLSTPRRRIRSDVSDWRGAISSPRIPSSGPGSFGAQRSIEVCLPPSSSSSPERFRQLIVPPWLKTTTSLLHLPGAAQSLPCVYSNIGGATRMLPAPRRKARRFMSILARSQEEERVGPHHGGHYVVEGGAVGEHPAHRVDAGLVPRLRDSAERDVEPSLG